MEETNQVQGVFDAKEIERQANRIKEQAQAFKKSCEVVLMCFRNIDKYVKTEDSNLSGAIEKLSEAYEFAYNEAINKYNILNEKMIAYATNTIKNEYTAQGNIDNLNKQIEDVFGYFQ